MEELGARITEIGLTLTKYITIPLTLVTLLIYGVLKWKGRGGLKVQGRAAQTERRKWTQQVGILYKRG